MMPIILVVNVFGNSLGCGLCQVAVRKGDMRRFLVALLGGILTIAGAPSLYPVVTIATPTPKNRPFGWLRGFRWFTKLPTL